MRIDFTEPMYSSSISYGRLAELQNKIIKADEKCEINFDIKSRIGLTFIFYIATLPLFAECNNKSISITCNTKILDLLYKCEFIKERITDTNYDVAPLLRDNTVLIETSDDVVQIVSKITKEAPVKMSEDLLAIFASKIGEMYNNAMEHSESEYIIGAKYYKNQKNVYCFSCCDFGIGIPQKVMHSHSEITDSKKAFEWAMKPGNSTVNSGVPRGLGLGLLKNFAKANNGVIRMCSNDVYYEFKNGQDYIKQIDNTLSGTLFEMDIIADNEHKYILK